MKTPLTAATIILCLTALTLFASVAQAQQSQYPVLDKVAEKVVAKYQSSTCEQLWQKKSQKAPPSAEEQKVIQFLKGDPQARQHFIDKIAAPIANKMFECGMVP